MEAVAIISTVHVWFRRPLRQRTSTLSGYTSLAVSRREVVPASLRYYSKYDLYDLSIKVAQPDDIYLDALASTQLTTGGMLHVIFTKNDGFFWLNIFFSTVEGIDGPPPFLDVTPSSHCQTAEICLDFSGGPPLDLPM